MFDDGPEARSFLVVAALVEAYGLEPTIAAQEIVKAKLPIYAKTLNAWAAAEKESSADSLLCKMFMAESEFFEFCAKIFPPSGEFDYKEQEVMMNLAAAAFLVGISNIRLRLQPAFEHLDLKVSECDRSDTEIDEDEEDDA